MINMLSVILLIPFSSNNIKSLRKYQTYLNQKLIFAYEYYSAYRFMCLYILLKAVVLLIAILVLLHPVSILVRSRGPRFLS